LLKRVTTTSPVSPGSNCFPGIVGTDEGEDLPRFYANNDDHEGGDPPKDIWISSTFRRAVYPDGSPFGAMKISWHSVGGCSIQ
jgi:hypothetical protein